MIRALLWITLIVTTVLVRMSPANAQLSGDLGGKATSAANIERGGYVGLEVTLTTTAANKLMAFNTACPRRLL